MSTNFDVPEALPLADRPQRSSGMRLVEDAYENSLLEPLFKTDTSAAALPQIQLTGIETNGGGGSNSTEYIDVRPQRARDSETWDPLKKPAKVGAVAVEKPPKEIVQAFDKHELLAAGKVGKSPPPLPPSPFTEPFDRGRAEEAVRKLGDPLFRVRQDGTGLLRRMGPPALPLLRDALRSDDPEVSMRAERVIRSIVAYEDSKATIEHFGAQRQAGPMYPTRRGELTPDEVRAYEGHLAAANKFLNADRNARFNQLDDFAKRAVRASIDIRLEYAQRLLNSENPANRERALSLLTEQLGVPGNLEDNTRFMRLAASAGGDLSPLFRTVFEKRGGNLKELELVAQRVRAGQK